MSEGDNSMKNVAETQIQHENNGCPPPTHPGGWRIAATHIDSSPVILGDTFTITMSERDVTKCKMMLDLQWFIMSIAAMSGAAGYPDLLPIVKDTQAMILEEWRRSYHFWRPNGAANCYYASPTHEAAGESRSQHPIQAATAFSPQPLSSRQLGPDDRLWSSPAARAPDGFFGPASFTAAYLETETSLAAGESSVPERVPSPTPPSVADIHNMANMDQGASYLATRILHVIPEQIPSEDRWSGMNCDDWVRIVGLPYWKFHAETVAMLTFAGRHDNCSKNLRGPTHTTIPCEILRRFSCSVFITDKFLATLVGRPPLLSRRFCSVELPLDIDDVALLTDKDSFDRCRESLNLDGWAVDSCFRAVTVLRIRMKIALIRDRILEFVMGHNCVQDNRDLLSVRVEEEKLYRELPVHFLYDPINGMQNLDMEGGHQKLLVRLDHLLNMFLIERLLVKRDPNSNRKDLLVISFEMVVLTLSIWTQRHIWAEVKGENQWTIRSYATLAGAILCMELISPSPVEDINMAIAGETYSRSSIIQQLSLLAGSLGSSQSSTSVKVRVVIKKVLDHILNDSRGPPAPVGLEAFDFNADWDIFTQLDNMDWLMDESVEASNH
ncbi:transcription factor [Fusarium sporotrichioides]|uniref:Transcription factor n=1 Tax=Fusarium sporotrichioides TaxID=5514 RepID=A0A395SCI4_FUSSP|nr:transcription factor [Fusarium sporotrichioides]